MVAADSIYFVKRGGGFDIYVTNGVGAIVASPLNQDLRDLIYLDTAGNVVSSLKNVYTSANFNKTGTGRITFTHSLNNVNALVEAKCESENVRDDVEARILRTSRTANSLQITTDEQDNGTTAGVPRDRYIKIWIYA